MGILGQGSSHGACSLLHAAGLGYGSSIALDLSCTVRLLDKPSKRELKDDSSLLDNILDSWVSSGRKLPKGLTKKELYWAVATKIPSKRGLKSSSAVSVAAIRALAKSVEAELTTAEIVDMAASAQISAGVSLTGSKDYTWACAEPGWALIDINTEKSADGLILKSPGPNPEDWTVLLLVREQRENIPDLEMFPSQQNAFSQALQALQDGQWSVAITWNGRAMVGVTQDLEGRKIANDAFVNGARAAGITGSGPAITVIVPSVSSQSIERLKNWYSSKYKDVEIIETKFKSDDSIVDEDL